MRNAGGEMVAVVAMTSDTLDLSQSNATCRVYHEYGETRVFFRHVNMDKVIYVYVWYRVTSHIAFEKCGLQYVLRKNFYICCWFL